MTRETPPDGHKLNETEWFTLRALADVIVPPSEKYGVPGAGDEDIAKNVIKDADGGRKLTRLVEALGKLEAMAQESGGAAFSAMDEDKREAVAFAFRDAHPGLANVAEMLVTQCYYRDDRVVISLGIDPRPPHPEGYKVEQGDWSVLDQVRRRESLYRPT